MNIGEISKPSVDRALVKKKKAVQSTETVEPIEPTNAVQDVAEFSEESKQKYENEQPKSNEIDLNKEESESSPKRIKIDIKV